MSSRRVGQGRVYVQLGDVDQLDFVSWVKGLAAGQSYVSDGFAHALDFEVNSTSPGPETVMLGEAGGVRVTAKVAFAPEIPKAVAYGTLGPKAGRRIVGDTVNLHAERSDDMVSDLTHRVELVVNGAVHASQEVQGDGKIHDLSFEVGIEESSWVALRCVPQLHTNPVTVHVAGKPIRASRESARWCEESVKRLWQNRNKFIAEQERADARAAYDRAIKRYQEIAEEAAG